jgi:hypothetical protein
MTTNPGEPVILATLADVDGELTPLLIDGYALLVTVRSPWPADTTAAGS